MRSVASVVSLDGFRIDVEEPLLPRMNSQRHSPDSQFTAPRFNPHQDSFASSLHHNDLSKQAMRHASDRQPGERVRDKKRYDHDCFHVLALLPGIEIALLAMRYRSPLSADQGQAFEPLRSFSRAVHAIHSYTSYLAVHLS